MNRKEHLLTIAAEECNEVAQRISKALRFGLTEIQPGQAYTNAERVLHEFADLCAAIETLEQEGHLGKIEVRKDFEARIEAKRAKVEGFLEFSKKCGTLKEE